MFSKKKLIILFFFTALQIYVHDVYADPDIEYKKKIEIVQHIVWASEEDVLHYNIVVEKKDDTQNAEGQEEQEEQEGSFFEFVRDITKDSFYDLTLRPGEYRYKIVAFDLLGRESPGSVWATLTVEQAHLPVITSLTPEVIFFDKGKDLSLTIKGENLFEDSIYKLDGAFDNPVEIKKVTADESGNTAEIIFNIPDKKSGAVNIIVENPGGLESNGRTVFITDKRGGGFGGGGDGKFIFSQGYVPIVPLNGNFEKYFISDVYLLGFAMHLGFMPFNFKYGSLGFDLGGFWTYMKSDNYDEINKDWYAKTQLINLNLFIFYQKTFANRFAVNVHVGAGATIVAALQINLANKLYENPQSITYINIATGASLKFSITDLFFLETGIDYLYVAASSGGSFLRPSLMVGWNF
ncbi:MAG: hypothetical protein Ta2G_05500 [Termitinemataceae bacterium]|nr:MAG: hypothetical protein Ta2G_05500 [Termitinemataceae bacterium]